MGIKTNQLSSALGLKGETPANRPGASAENDIRYDPVKQTEINNSPLNVESDTLQGSKYNQAKPYTNPEG
tara:strand:+ start:114 stop:323 length:210 start_codon:yes stop_codon:yes gene_type:complete